VGPTCEVLLEADDESMLDAIDAVLAAAADNINRTRKGRVWDIWVGGRPVQVSVEGSPPAVNLASGCNGPEDYRVLRQLAHQLAVVPDGGAGRGAIRLPRERMGATPRRSA
jgi:hypothetical protein